MILRWKSKWEHLTGEAGYNFLKSLLRITSQNSVLHWIKSLFMHNRPLWSSIRSLLMSGDKVPFALMGSGSSPCSAAGCMWWWALWHFLWESTRQPRAPSPEISVTACGRSAQWRRSSSVWPDFLKWDHLKSLLSTGVSVGLSSKPRVGPEVHGEYDVEPGDTARRKSKNKSMGEKQPST